MRLLPPRPARRYGELLASDGDIRLIVKEMPILGPGSELAARAAVATLIGEGPEAYATLHDRLMAVQGQVTDLRNARVFGNKGAALANGVRSSGIP